MLDQPQECCLELFADARRNRCRRIEFRSHDPGATRSDALQCVAIAVKETGWRPEAGGWVRPVRAIDCKPILSHRTKAIRFAPTPHSAIRPCDLQTLCLRMVCCGGIRQILDHKYTALTNPSQQVLNRPPAVTAVEWLVMAVVSTGLIAASSLNWWSITLVETLGFVSGGICVWLVVREQPANWPVGIANNLTFGVLFWNSRLFADMGLQVVYAFIAVYGWWNWSHGRVPESRLPITRTQKWEWGLLGCLIPVATWIMYSLLVIAGGALPFWDALTTAMSLAAQYLLAQAYRKLVLVDLCRHYLHTSLPQSRPAIDRSLVRRLPRDVLHWVGTMGETIPNERLAIRSRTMSFSRGLVIGKFLPLHRGHELLIETAIAQCEMVTVMAWRQGHRCPAPGRRTD